ncbi:MAG: hypothetical protein QGG88_03490 [Gammaproteobacteria bacterium]|nr:hypothetical protein [Gammaproteobacteria bacterium]
MQNAILRPPAQAMDLHRLGAGFASRLSFMRTLVRHMMANQWRIEYSRFDLDKHGYGQAVFDIQTPNSHLSFVVFSQYLDPNERDDRVIAEQWDLTMTLLEGEVDDVTLAMLAANVPLQEAGRIDARSISLARANRSARVFSEVLENLRHGRQPDVKRLSEVGYLYRTTAVYGAGKFGACDWDKVVNQHPDLASPFASEMLVCYLLRQFSLDQLHHMVHQDAYPHAVDMDVDLQRYLGIGNSTGLGMAPWLINHPQVMAQWVLQRETALARVLQMPVAAAQINQLQELMTRACQHIREVSTFDAWQANNNHILLADLEALSNWFNGTATEVHSWQQIHQWAERNYSLETQELLLNLMLELYPQMVDSLAQQMAVVESLQYDPTAYAQDLADAVQDKYDWVFDYDFNDPQQGATFWYYSQNKIEPRLGKVGTDAGAELQMFLGIARAVQDCHTDLLSLLAIDQEITVADFLLRYPSHQGIVARIATMSQTTYGEIRANLLDANVLPMHLLRAKLAFFGVSKFDPKSALWVRNTMFQGAPLISELGTDGHDDWSFPVAPTITVQQEVANG